MANKVLSIYVGNDSIRIAELLVTNKDLKLTNAAEVNTPEKAVEDGMIKSVSEVTDAIRQVVYGKGFTAKEVIFTISSKKVGNKEIEVPYVKSASKLQSILQTNATQYFPMSASGNYSFAFAPLEDIKNAEGVRLTRVTAVAVPDEMLEAYYQIAEELKFKIKSIDYFGNSVIQLLSKQMTEGSVDLVLQIEKDTTFVNVMRGKTLVLQRNITFGQKHVVHALMDVMHISEKDATTLLSNEQLVQQHITDDQYSEAVRGLVSGIGKAVEYYRTKNSGGELQRVRLFGEGCSIAGIERTLERELGAKVEHFENLDGVTVMGQASLTAQEVLKYLPNIGAVINPMGLSIDANAGSGSSIDDIQLIKALRIVLVVAAIAMIIFTSWTIIESITAVNQKEEVEKQIAAIQEIEDIFNAHEDAKEELNIVTDFEASTHSDNEYLLQLVQDMEKIMPKETYVETLTTTDGVLEMKLVTGWHEMTKNEVADIMVTLGGLDYVYGLDIPNITEDYETRIVTKVNPDGTYEYLRAETTGDEPAEYIKYDENNKVDVEKYADDIKVTLVKTSFTVNLNLGYPEVDETEAVSDNGISENAEPATEEGAAQ